MKAVSVGVWDIPQHPECQIFYIESHFHVWLYPLDPALRETLGKLSGFRIWFEKRLDDAIQAENQQNQDKQYHESNGGGNGGGHGRNEDNDSQGNNDQRKSSKAGGDRRKSFFDPSFVPTFSGLSLAGMAKVQETKGDWRLAWPS